MRLHPKPSVSRGGLQLDFYFWVCRVSSFQRFHISGIAEVICLEITAIWEKYREQKTTGPIKIKVCLSLTEWNGVFYLDKIVHAVHPFPCPRVAVIEIRRLWRLGKSDHREYTGYSVFFPLLCPAPRRLTPKAVSLGPLEVGFRLDVTQMEDTSKRSEGGREESRCPSSSLPAWRWTLCGYTSCQEAPPPWRQTPGLLPVWHHLLLLSLQASGGHGSPLTLHLEALRIVLGSCDSFPPL